MISFLQQRAEEIVSSRAFQRGTLAAILLSSLLLGLETSPAVRASAPNLLAFADRLLLAFFVLELGTRILTFGPAPWRFFRDGWNSFDFLVVAGCLVPGGGQSLAILRLVRVLRVLRLVTALPRLRLIVGSLLKSIPAMGSVSVLLFLHFYTYGVLGVTLFGKADPIHFGTLAASLLTLFKVLTLEGWVDIMEIQLKACDTALPWAACGNGSGVPTSVTIGFFLSFIVFGTMIILNLLIGVVVNSLSEVAREEAPDSGLDSKISGMEQKLDRLYELLSSGKDRKAS